MIRGDSLFGFKDFERAKSLCNRLIRIYFSYYCAVFEADKKWSFDDFPFLVPFGNYFYHLSNFENPQELNRGMKDLIFVIADSDLSSCSQGFQAMVDQLLMELRNEHDSYVDHVLSDYGIDRNY